MFTTRTERNAVIVFFGLIFLASFAIGIGAAR